MLNRVSTLGLLVVGVLMFILALELLKKGAGGIAGLLTVASAQGMVNLVGFGWLMAYVALSGSPIAATSLTLLGANALTPLETFAMINGSRFGASFVVLFTGFIYYLRGAQGRPVVSMGVLSMITTATIYLPAMLVGAAVIHWGWLDAVRFGSPRILSSLVDVLYDPLTGLAATHLHPLVMFILGFVTLLVAFRVFDKSIPQMDSGLVERRLLDRPLVMFLLGLAVTSITLSVSISLTILVPLAARGLVKPRQAIPYIMGANISTFVDTLFASLLVSHPLAFTVVLTEMLAVAAVSVIVLSFFYQLYQNALLQFDRAVRSSRMRFAGFVLVLALVPMILFLI